MPKMNPYRLTGPEMDLSTLWAAGVFEAAARVDLIRTAAQRTVSTRIYARVNAAVGIKLQEILGGSYSGKYWRVPPQEQIRVCSKMLKYVLDEKMSRKLSAVLAYRRTLCAPGVPVTPAVMAYRERLARAYLDLPGGIPTKDILPDFHEDTHK